MNEKKKMLLGKLYNPMMDVLPVERERAKMLCYKFNKLAPNNILKRTHYLSRILGKTGKNYLIEQPFQCDYGYNIEIGENFYSNHNLIILDPAKVIFGDNVFVGPNCGFYTPEHPIEAETRIKGLEFAKPIKVGNNVWFGGNVVVLGGVTIGDNVVIGAGSVVTKDIPSNTIAVGNPCRIIRELWLISLLNFYK